MPAFPKPTATETDPVASPTAAAALALAESHAARHKSGGADPIKLDEFAVPTDVTTLNADTSKHGLLPKLDGSTSKYLRADGAWSTIVVPDTPWHVPINFAGTPSTVTGNWTTTRDVSNNTHVTRYLNPATLNDQIGWDIVLGAGTWRLSVTFTAGSGFGIGTWSIDGTSIGTIDYYASGFTYNNLTDIAGISVAATGVKRLLCKMASKNASASGYGAALASIVLQRTA